MNEKKPKTRKRTKPKTLKKSKLKFTDIDPKLIDLNVVFPAAGQGSWEHSILYDPSNGRIINTWGQPFPNPVEENATPEENTGKSGP